MDTKQIPNETSVKIARLNDALRERYLGMAEDVAMIRKNREERRKRAAEAKKS